MVEMMVKKIFNVTAQRTPRGNWTLVEPTLGAVSEVRNLSQAAKDMLEPVAYLAGLKENEIEINIVPILPKETQEQLAEVETARNEAERASKRAASQYRSTVRAMHKTGITYRDIGVLLGISHQRVSQLIAESK